MDCEPDLTKSLLEDNMYCEGNEEAGFIPLSHLLDSIAEVINCDNSNYYNDDIKFQYFVRRETEEEMEEEGHGDSIDWYTVDENIDIEKLNIQFEFE